MKFCPQCQNMLYGIEETEEGAMFTCRKCDYKEALTRENPIVYEHKLTHDTSESIVLNPYLKYDPTLEHLTTHNCPNKMCPTKTTKGLSADVVAVEMNAKKLLWMYQCTHCDYSWKQSGRAS